MAGIGSAALARLATLEREVIRNRHLMRLGYRLSSIAGDAELAEFAALQAQLFEGVRFAGQGAVVVDSSKAGPRAWALAPGLKPAILHVYRGAEDVIASWRRPKFDPSTNAPMKKPSLAVAAMDWIKAEQAARSLAKCLPVRRLDYGDFATDPQSALTRALEPEFPGLVQTMAWTGRRTVRPAAQYHSVLGNPDRFDRADIRIAPQRAADRSRFGAAEQGVIGTLGKTLEWVYP